MPLFGKQVNLEEVRKQYVQFIATIMEELRQKGQQINPSEAAQFLKQFVPRAKQIITPSIAKQMDKDKSRDQIVYFVDPDFLETLPENNITMYLILLLFTVEDTLGTGQTFLRNPIVLFGGAEFYRKRGAKEEKENNYVDAEKEFKQSLFFANLWQNRNDNVLLALYHLGICKSNQGLTEEAEKYYQETIDYYPKLSSRDQSDETVQKIVAHAQEMLT
jgi:tetratricopeptide (TPR) repeat protein